MFYSSCCHWLSCRCHALNKSHEMNYYSMYLPNSFHKYSPLFESHSLKNANLQVFTLVWLKLHSSCIWCHIYMSSRYSKRYRLCSLATLGTDHPVMQCHTPYQWSPLVCHWENFMISTDVASYSRRSLQNNFFQKVLLAISHTLPEDNLAPMFF